VSIVQWFNVAQCDGRRKISSEHEGYSAKEEKRVTCKTNEAQNCVHDMTSSTTKPLEIRSHGLGSGRKQLSTKEKTS
jgi:hypothetical protein